jgi:hypothetical protein
MNTVIFFKKIVFVSGLFALLAVNLQAQFRLNRDWDNQ